MKRTPVIILIAIAQFLVGSLSLVSGVFLLLLMTGAVQVFSQDLTGLSLYFKGLIVLRFAISIFGLAVTYGLWTLKRWGWIGSLLFQGLCIANNGLGLLIGHTISAGVYVSAIFCTGLIAALCLPSVKTIFEVEGSEADVVGG
ncbi:MAG: hypothetical protein AAFW75_09605 [Cyanobacteria bacterium J06636_16]